MTTQAHHEKAPLPEHILRLHELDDVWRAPSAGERLERAKSLAPRFRERLSASGRVVSVRTFDTSALPYPTAFAFAGAALSPVPYIVMTNRVNVVQFEDDDHQLRTLLFNPTDVDRSARTPFFADLRARMGEAISARVMAALRQPTPAERLRAIGLGPEDVDYIAFDHMHTQDVRGLLGTAPSRDEESVRAVFPRAKLLIWRPELEIFRSLHPLQRPWYIAEGVRHVPPDRFVVCDGDVLLGKGVALVRTPGHTVGNWSLALNTDNGIWTVSENGVSADSYSPEASRIPGIRKHARRAGVEVVLNANTLEGRNEQYTSMVLEKSIADRCRDDPDFVQHFPSSELTATPLTPGLSPTYRHGGIQSGEVRR
jgi:hypothetical protein